MNMNIRKATREPLAAEEEGALPHFPDYCRHTDVATFVEEFVATAHSMLQDDAIGRVLAFRDSEVHPIDHNDLLELLDIGSREQLHGKISAYEMFLFDGGNTSGDIWKSTFHPRQLVQVFVDEK
jgi:hypothetical protein